VQARQQHESAQAAAAHRQHMRAVQARLPRGQLAELGAAFRQRLEEQFGVAAAAAAGQAVSSMTVDNHCGATCNGKNEAVGGDLLVLQESAGGQALLVAASNRTEGSGSSSSRRPCSAPGPGTDVQGGAVCVAGRPPLSRHSSSSKLVGKSRAGSSAGGSAAASQPASAAASRRSTPERERLEQQPAGAGR
jgi:hypothetical protein